MRLLDTSVAVDHLRGHQPATRVLEELLGAQVALVSSEVVRFELLAGMRDTDEAVVERFCEAVDWVPVTEPVARQDPAVLGRAAPTVTAPASTAPPTLPSPPPRRS